jgi:antitoxin component YwqK of YwqJK toxin-antitoxin module
MFVMHKSLFDMKKFVLLFCLFPFFTAFSQTKTLYYPNGNKMCEGMLSGADPIVFTGSFEQLDKETRLRYLDLAKREGTWKQWFDNGQLQSVEEYSNGVLQGDAIHYYPDGTHEAFLHIGGNQPSVFYHMNGQKESEGIILKGYIYHGPWKGWLSNGKIGYEGSYVNGQRDGLWQWYDETGKLRTKQVFNLGTLVSENNF